MEQNTYYFVGIKGTGMASLARILHDKGHQVLKRKHLHKRHC